MFDDIFVISTVGFHRKILCNNSRVFLNIYSVDELLQSEAIN